MDEVHIDLARMIKRLQHRVLGDFVEHDAVVLVDVQL